MTLKIRIVEGGAPYEQVRAQIEVAEEYGLGWMLWNAASNVTLEALDPE